MKGLIFLLTTIAFLLPYGSIPQLSACAQTNYACILTDDVYLYETERSDSGLFIIPRTFYVKVLKEGAIYSKVEYAENKFPYLPVTGYCKTNLLYPATHTPLRPYFSYVLSVEYTLSTNTPVHSDFNELTVQYAYYGDIFVGSALYYYVCDGTKFGYIPKTEEISIDRNDDCPIPPSEEGSSPPKSNVQPTPTAGQIILCILIMFLIALAAFFSLWKKKSDQ